MRGLNERDETHAPDRRTVLKGLGVSDVAALYLFDVERGTAIKTKMDETNVAIADQPTASGESA